MRKTILLITLGLVGLSSQSQALTTTKEYSYVTLDLTKDSNGTLTNGNKYSYNATTSILSQYDVSQGVLLTFSSKTWAEHDLIVFTSAKGSGNPPVNGDSTGLLGAANGALKGVWGGHTNYCWNSGSNTAIAATKITDTIKVEMTKSAGVSVYNASGTRLVNYSGLQAGTADRTTTYFNQTYVSSIGLVDDIKSYTYSNADGSWGQTYDGDKVIDATNGEKKFAFNSDIPADLDIVAGGDGYVFFEEWLHGDFNFANNFYIGSRTNGAEAIHFGSDDGNYTTTLTGNIYLVDDAVIKARGEDTVSIQGKVTDKNVPNSTKTDGGYKLTVAGEGYEFTGDVDVTTLEFGATQGIHTYTRNTEATFTKGFKADNLILNTNNHITSLATIDGLTTLTVKGADATLDAALDLSTATTLTMDAALALGDNALTLGSMTLAGTLFTTMDTTLETSETLTLFTGVNSLTLGTTSYAGAVDASTVFTNLAAGNYSLVYADSVVALKKGVTDVVPEPTTATLSLLALCGLAMRRRRK